MEKIDPSAIDRFRDHRVLVIGETGIDEYIWGETRRISPEAPVPVVEVESITLRLGLAGNVAHNIAAVGGNVKLVSIRGHDSDGETLESMVRDCGIKESLFLVDESRPTLRKVRIIAAKQHVVRVDYEKTHQLSAKTAVAYHDAILSEVSDCDAVIIQDYGKGVWTTDTAVILDDIKKSGKKVYVDPNRNGKVTLYRGATLITPNLSEAEVLSGFEHLAPRLAIADGVRLRRMAERLLSLMRCEHVVITCGEGGMVALERDTGDFHQVPTFARDVSDVTGAGDTVIALMALMHLTGASIKQCMGVANAAAGLVVARLGTAAVSSDELREELARLNTLAKREC
jgi:rfaE bifunctional protein kinase chain/domain